ncbi:copper amine oxidase N-terminal domain-containing protein [Candidatus Desulforudis audaxviator]|uniref:Copper amine oxidase domain protein n=1 Tax=Desulforudis audaxviator (strain MP104C) TaxID=477974 RepID=B1I3C5_DESAP|nr:copper amine oxidase N-terminal domain-containing protein [Candidatus Desulforudis audaxviator]ACA59490.1 copper amine oxidase domain protein [Candidatus Desulforudis audaxviator MP104C]
MSRYLTIAAMVLLLSFSFLIGADAVENRGIIVDGTRLVTNVNAYDVAGRIMVPLRPLAERLGGRVDFNYETGMVEVRRGQKHVIIPQHSLTYYENGRPKRTEWPAEIVNGRMMVPSSLIDDFFGSKTYCDGRNGFVIVLSR